MSPAIRAQSAVNVRHLILLGLMAIVSGVQPCAAASEASPFDALVGSWFGSGQIRLEAGNTERLNCNAYYTGGGSQLSMAIRCTSDTSNVEIRSKLHYNAGRVTGSWEERTFNAEGSASGKATATRVALEISGGVWGSMSVSYTRTHQDVSIVTQGIPLKGVSISLSRK